MELFELLQKVAEVFERNQIQYLVTGAMASVAYGEPRLTNDIDIVAAINKEHVPGLLEAFPPDEFYASEEAIKDAIRNQGQFNIIHSPTGLKIDIVVRKETPYHQVEFERRRREPILPGRDAYFARPEDVILNKLLYFQHGGSERHLRDIAGMLRVSRAEIDTGYIDDWAERLGVGDTWRAVRER